MTASLTTAQQTEYASLYAQREELQSVLRQRLAGGVASASISSGGASQSYTNRGTDEIRAQIRALTRRMLELLGVSPAGRVFCSSVPDFGP